MAEHSGMDDPRMVDWLYGELDEAEAARFEAELAQDPDMRAEANALRRTRELVGSLADHEPPAALTSFLLHAAAKEVVGAPEPAQREAKAGLWGGMLEALHALTRRPALATVAGLVVVVGVAGALYSRGGLRSVANQATVPSVVGEDSAVATREPIAMPDEAAKDQGGQTSADEERRLEEPAAEQAPAPATLPAPGSKLDKMEASAQPQGIGARGGSVLGGMQDESKNRTLRRASAEKRPPVAKSKSKKMAPSRSDKPLDGMVSTSSEAGAKPFASAPPSPAPRQQRSVEVAGEATAAEPSAFAGGALAEGAADRDQADRKGAFRPYEQRRREADDRWAEKQSGALAAAAKRRDCKSAGRIANDILDRNPDFYYQRVKKSEPVKKCQFYVTTELRRRQEVRSRSGAGSGSSRAAPARKKANRAAKEMEADDSAATTAE